MELTGVAKKVIHVVAIVAGCLLLVLLGVYIGYLKFGHGEAEEEEEPDVTALSEISLKPFNEEDRPLNMALAGDYDFTILEIWDSDSGDCIRYISEMNMFSEECDHRDDEIYSYVAGVCTNLYDEAGELSAKRLDTAKAIAENGKVRYPLYVADPETVEIIRSLGIENLPAVIFINRKGEIMDICSGLTGKELCVRMDELVEELMKLDWEKERVRILKERGN